MKHAISVAAYCVACCTFPLSASAQTYMETFDGPGAPSHLTPSATAGFAINYTGGRAVLSKAAGIGNGSAALGVDFPITGDFSISVQTFFDNVNGAGEAGLGVNFGSIGFVDIFSIGPTLIDANIAVPGVPGFGDTQVNHSATSVTFQIKREGTTVSLFLDTGSGLTFRRGATSPLLTGPVTAYIFLAQERGNTSAHQVSFDNFYVNPVPEPATYGLLLAGLGCIVAATRQKHAAKYRSV